MYTGNACAQSLTGLITNIVSKSHAKCVISTYFVFVCFVLCLHCCSIFL